MYYNHKIKHIFNQVKVGDYCYKSFRGYDEPCADCPIKDMKDSDLSYTKLIYNCNISAQLETTVKRVRWINGQDVAAVTSIDIQNIIMKSRIKVSYFLNKGGIFFMRIYFRGNLYGCNQATAFVEDKGKIIFIGSDKEALKYSGEQIDLNNKYVYSGFNDSHMHLVNYGQSLKNVLLEKHTNSLKAL